MARSGLRVSARFIVVLYAGHWKMEDLPRATMDKVVYRLCFEFICFLKDHIPESLHYQWRYFRAHGRLCNFQNPRRFSEKIYHRMRFPLADFSRLADKVVVRDYIRDTVGDQFNVPLYIAVTKVVPELFDVLPSAFVMKCNNACGTTRVVLDKASEDIHSLVDLANSWLQRDFSRCNGERHYRSITPQILFEKALLIEGRPAADYKVHVFNPAEGDAYCFLQVIGDRFGQITQNLYSTDWMVTAFKLGGRLPPSTCPSITMPPAQLPQMLDAAKRLAKPFGYCRVDFYVHDGNAYVGELTFTPGAGRCVFHPAQWDWTLGAKFRWPETLELPSPSIPMPGVTEVQSSGDQQLA